MVQLIFHGAGHRRQWYPNCPHFAAASVSLWKPGAASTEDAEIQDIFRSVASAALKQIITALVYGVTLSTFDGFYTPNSNNNNNNNNNKPPSLQTVSDFQVSGCSSLDGALGSDPAADLQQAKGGTKQLLQPAKAVLTCTYRGGALTHGSIRCKIRPLNKIKCLFLFLRFWNEINEISDIR